MFRLFLMDQLAKGMEKVSKELEDSPLPKHHARNRRIYERFPMEHKHLALLNDQDILIVRDLSMNGFSTEVSKRCYLRLNVNDEYRCRVRYLGEIYDFEARVSWKSRNFVGFELVKDDFKVKKFLLRLLKPIEIGLSLKKADDKFAKNTNKKEHICLQGIANTELSMWFDEGQRLKSWELEIDKKFIKWDPFDALVTGKLKNEETGASLLKPWEKEKILDQNVNQDLKQFALDLFMVLRSEQKDELLETLDQTQK